jgi:tetratricopeptide (TPR) repeat protein
MRDCQVHSLLLTPSFCVSWSEALQAYQAAERLAPAKSETHSQLARVYRRLGDVAAAERASQLHQKYRPLQRAYQQLIDLASDAQSADDFLKLARGVVWRRIVT